MPITPHSPVAFRCKTCGRFHTGGDAGEAPHPHACRVCGSGVSFDPRTARKSVDGDCWERLADATPERLAGLGLSPADVEAHTPTPEGTRRGPRHVTAAAEDGSASGDATL